MYKPYWLSDASTSTIWSHLAAVASKETSRQEATVLVLAYGHSLFAGIKPSKNPVSLGVDHLQPHPVLLMCCS